MNHKRLLPQMIGLILVALLLVACGVPEPTLTPTPIPPTPTTTSTPTPTATSTATPTSTPTATPTSTPTATPVPISISGRAHTTGDPPQPAPHRKVVLCLVKEVTREEDAAAVKASCVLDASLTTVTDSEGRFEFRLVPEGSYIFLYDDASEDFEAGLQEWAGKTIKIWDEDWLSQFEDEGGLPIDNVLFTELVNKLGFQNMKVLAFLTTYINGFRGFPFLVAIEIDLKAVAFTPMIVEVKAGDTAEVDIEVLGSKQK